MMTEPTYIPEGKYFTKKQVAEKCEVIHQTVQQWIDKGWIKIIDIPGLGYIVSEEALNEFLSAPRPQRGYPKGKPRK